MLPQAGAGRYSLCLRVFLDTTPHCMQDLVSSLICPKARHKASHVRFGEFDLLFFRARIRSISLSPFFALFLCGIKHHKAALYTTAYIVPASHPIYILFGRGKIFSLNVCWMLRLPAIHGNATCYVVRPVLERECLVLQARASHPCGLSRASNRSFLLRLARKQNTTRKIPHHIG